MRASDAGDRALVAEERMKLSPVALEDLTERRGVQAECVRPQMSEIVVQLGLCDEPYAGALLLSALGQDELVASREAQPEHGCLRFLLSRTQVAQTSGAHQMHAEDEIRVLDREEKVLPATPRALEAPTVELGERRHGGLERRDVGWAGLLDRRA